MEKLSLSFGALLPSAILMQLFMQLSWSDVQKLWAMIANNAMVAVEGMSTVPSCGQLSPKNKYLKIS